MKLKALFENGNILNKEIARKIISDCQPYLQEIQYDVDNFRLHRGLVLDSFKRRAKEVAENVYKAVVRKDRAPLNTPQYLHTFIDNWMNEKLGAKFRSGSIFCAPNYHMVLSFGKPYVIMPIGEFAYAWSPFIEDLYSDVEEISFASKEDDDQAKSKIADVLENAKYRTDGIRTAMREYPKHEIMVECDSYYAFEANTFDNYFCPLYDLVSK